MSKDARSSLLKKNIYFSFLIKGWSGVVQLLIVPITLLCLGNYENGIWMTISSILIWMDSLDIGLGNGLRNKLAAQLASDEKEKARESVSSTFFMLIFIMVPTSLLLMSAIRIFDFYNILNVDNNMVANLNEALIVAILFVSTTFIFKFTGNVYLGMQLPAINNALVVGGQTLSLVGVYILHLLDIHSLTAVAFVYTASPTIVYLTAYTITFNVRYKWLRPSFSYFNKNAVKSLFNTGVKFFILQISGIILFASSNVIISRLFTPEMVTPYQVAYRYFSIVVMLFSIVAVPYWSATTDAFTRKDFEWIKKSRRNMNKIIYAIIAILTCMILCSGFAYKIWVGSKVHIPLELSIGMALYVFTIIYSLSYSYFLNGMGALKLQLYFTVLAAILYIPTALLISDRLGITGIIFALCLVNIPGAIINKIQFTKILSNTDNKIWNE